MPLSSDVLLDHIASMLRYLSGAASFWFTLDTSYDHSNHLSKRFGMYPDEYESLLVAANLAHHLESGFAIKPKEWGEFLAGSRFMVAEAISECRIEFTKKIIDYDALNNGTKSDPKRRFWGFVVRIGVVSENSPTKIEMQKDWFDVIHCSFGVSASALW